MLTKKKVLQSIKELPDHFSIDELIDRVMLLQKVERGLQESHLGKTFSTEDAKEKLKKWL